MTDAPAEIPAEVPAGLNGSAPGTLTPAKQTAQGVAAIAGMLSQFPQALAQVLQQVPVQAQTRQHLCATCVLGRLTWNVAHERELTAAIEMAARVHGLADGDPRLGQLDPVPFLPESLRPGGPQGMPPANPSITAVGGTEVCSEHIPGRPGGKQLLLMPGPLSQGMLASFAGIR